MKTRAIIFFTAIMIATLSSGAHAADWNMQGNDAGHTSYTTIGHRLRTEIESANIVL